MEDRKESYVRTQSGLRDAYVAFRRISDKTVEIDGRLSAAENDLNECKTNVDSQEAQLGKFRNSVNGRIKRLQGRYRDLRESVKAYETDIESFRKTIAYLEGEAESRKKESDEFSGFLGRIADIMEEGNRNLNT